MKMCLSRGSPRKHSMRQYAICGHFVGESDPRKQVWRMGWCSEWVHLSSTTVHKYSATPQNSERQSIYYLTVLVGQESRSSTEECLSLRVSHKNFSTGLTTGPVAFSRTRAPRREREQKRASKSKSFYNLIPEGTFYHCCHIMFLQKSLGSTHTQGERITHRHEFHETGHQRCLETGMGVHIMENEGE